MGKWCSHTSRWWGEINMINDKLKENNKELWERYVKHDFVVKMRNGTLNLENFRYYLIQDSKYVKIMLKSLIKASSLGPIEQTSKILTKIFQTRDKGVEVHSFLLDKLGITEKEIEKTGYSLVNYAYTRHLYYYSTIGWAEFLAAWAPCMWGYYEIGKYVIDTSNNIYKKWAEFYASDEYKSRIDIILDSLNSIDYKEELNTIFRDSINFEIMFWESALRNDETKISGIE